MIYGITDQFLGEDEIECVTLAECKKAMSVADKHKDGERDTVDSLGVALPISLGDITALSELLIESILDYTTDDHPIFSTFAVRRAHRREAKAALSREPIAKLILAHCAVTILAGGTHPSAQDRDKAIAAMNFRFGNAYKDVRRTIAVTIASLADTI